MLAALQRVAEQHPDRIAIEEPNQHVSYAQLWHAIQEASTLLKHAAPRVVAIDLANSSHWVITHFACLHAGLAQLPLPPFFTPEQRAHAVRDAGADLLISEYATTVLENPAIALPEGTALITYTSGSTGAPKGVCLSAQGMKQVAASLVHALGPHLAQRHLSILPLGVLLEQVGGLYPTLMSGGTYVIAPFAQQPAPLFMALAQSEATSGILVPELLKMLVHHCQQQQATLPKLRFLAVGGARVGNDLLRTAMALGLPIYQGYGLSESASVVAVNSPAANKPGTVGRVLPHIAYTIAEDGELMLQNPAMLGYAGGHAWDGDYPTGDLATVDAEGYLTIHGRKKNILITGYGRNVSPEWPEAVLLAQPEIAQAMVYGDGEAELAALIVPTGPWPKAALAAAIARTNAQLPEYARIGQWEQHAPFTPQSGQLTGTGRIRRDAILASLSLKEPVHAIF